MPDKSQCLTNRPARLDGWSDPRGLLNEYPGKSNEPLAQRCDSKSAMTSGARGRAPRLCPPGQEGCWLEAVGVKYGVMTAELVRCMWCLRHQSRRKSTEGGARPPRF
jgi:hypothetical protein